MLTTRGVNTAKQGVGYVWLMVRKQISHLDIFGERKILINDAEFVKGWLWREKGKWLSQVTAALNDRENKDLAVSEA